jgi:quinol monooxygenase YgiN
MNSRKILSTVAIIALILTGVYTMKLVEAQSNTITFTAKLTIKAGKEKEFETLMKGIVPKVRQEPGNKAYTMCRSKENPRVFMFFEEYVDQEALKAHGQHLKELGADIVPYFDGPAVAEYYDKIAD